MKGNLREKLIGDKRFYKMVLLIAVPIMIQNGITNFVSLLDNIMVGQVGTEQMTGVAIVNQLIFVYNLCIFGGVSGAGIFTAQFFGQKDDEGVANTFRFKLLDGSDFDGNYDFDTCSFWRASDSDVFEWKPRRRRYSSSTFLWKKISLDHACRSSGVYGGTGLCQHPERVRKYHYTNESGNHSRYCESGI